MKNFTEAIQAEFKGSISRSDAILEVVAEHNFASNFREPALKHVKVHSGVGGACIK